MKRLPLLLLFLLGCPDEMNVLDGSVADSGPRSDASEDDGGLADTSDAGSVSGEVVVRLSLGGVSPPPGYDYPVIFHGADDSIIEAQLDQNGEARAELPQGAKVTVIGRSATNGFILRTLAGIDPPETLTIELSEFPVEERAGDVTVSIAEAYPGADDHQVDFGCGLVNLGDPPQPVRFEITTACVGTSSTIAIMAAARDFQRNLIAYAVEPSIPIGDGVTATVSAPWRTELESFDVSFTNAPAFVDFINVNASLVLGAGRYVSTVRGSAVDEGSASIAFALPSFGEARDINAAMTSAIGDGGFFLRVAPTGPVPIDLGLLLPYVQDIAIDVSQDSARPRITWAFDRSEVADLTIVQLRTDADLEWEIALPGGATSLVLPPLPDLLGASQPGPSTSYSEPAVGIFESSLHDGFRALRDSSPNDAPIGIVRSVIPLRDVPVGTIARYSSVGGF